MLPGTSPRDPFPFLCLQSLRHLLLEHFLEHFSKHLLQAVRVFLENP